MITAANLRLSNLLCHLPAHQRERLNLAEANGQANRVQQNRQIRPAAEGSACLVLGTYHAILESKANPVIPENFEDLARQLQELNRQVIESRQSKSPGEFKSESNRAGNTVFVMPDLVVGTLTEGYEIIMSAATPPNRAALAMFIVAEVHPFTAGSGRTARLAMNQFLTQSGLTRIITPTVYRDDYISALKAMSSNSYPQPGEVGRLESHGK